VHLVGFTIKKYQDARLYERQKYEALFQCKTSNCFHLQLGFEKRFLDVLYEKKILV